MKQIKIKKSRLDEIIKETAEEVFSQSQVESKLKNKNNTDDTLRSVIQKTLLSEASKKEKKAEKSDKTKEAKEVDDIEKQNSEHYTYNQLLFNFYKKLKAPSSELGISIAVALRLLNVLDYMVNKVSKRGNLTVQQVKMIEKAIDSRFGGK